MPKPIERPRLRALSGTLAAARWFRYEAAVVPIEIGSLAAPAEIAAGADLVLSGQAP
jgi:hypothetical protein